MTVGVGENLPVDEAAGQLARADAPPDGGLLAEGVKACPFLIKPNDAELSRLTGRSFTGIADMARAARELVRGGVGTAVVSLGGDGVVKDSYRK